MLVFPPILSRRWLGNVATCVSVITFSFSTIRYICSPAWTPDDSAGLRPTSYLDQLSSLNFYRRAHSSRDLHASPPKYDNSIPEWALSLTDHSTWDAGPHLEYHNVAVCVGIKNEERFLDEFILYHRALGITRFYIYEYNSSDTNLKILGPYIAEGIVTLHQISNQSLPHMFQENLLRSCFHDYGSKVNWLAHFDVDEFLAIQPRIDDPSEPYEDDMTGEWRYPLHDLLRNEDLDKAIAVHVSRHNFINAIGISELGDGQLVMDVHVYRDLVKHEDESFWWTKAIAHPAFTSDRVLIRDSHHVEIPLLSRPSFNLSSPLNFNSLGQPLPHAPKSGTYPGQMKHIEQPLILHHYLQRDLQNCFTKYQERLECCPNSWRTKVGKNWCYDTSIFVPDREHDDNKKESKRRKERLVFDDAVRRSIYASQTRSVLALWKKSGRPEVDWEKVSEMVVRIDYDLTDFFKNQQRPMSLDV